MEAVDTLKAKLEHLFTVETCSAFLYQERNQKRLGCEYDWSGICVRGRVSKKMEEYMELHGISHFTSEADAIAAGVAKPLNF